jgi:hypothetical protein
MDYNRMTAPKITAHNAGWRFSAYAKATVDRQFRCSAFVHFGATGAGGVLWSGMCELRRSHVTPNQKAKA